MAVREGEDRRGQEELVSTVELARRLPWHLVVVVVGDVRVTSQGCCGGGVRARGKAVVGTGGEERGLK